MYRISSLEYWQNLCVHIINIDGLHFIELAEVITAVEDQGRKLSTHIIEDDKTRLLPYSSTIDQINICDTGYTYFVPISIIEKYIL